MIVKPKLGKPRLSIIKSVGHLTIVIGWWHVTFDWWEWENGVTGQLVSTTWNPD